MNKPILHSSIGREFVARLKERVANPQHFTRAAVSEAKRDLKLLAVAATLVASSGCASTLYHEKNGVTLLRLTLGTDQQIGEVLVRTKESQVKVGSAKTEQSTTAGAAAGAAVEALKPRIIP